jgi:hypothetical protein
MCPLSNTVALGQPALVSVVRGGRDHRLLFGTGISPDGLVENMRPRVGLMIVGEPLSKPRGSFPAC